GSFLHHGSSPCSLPSHSSRIVARHAHTLTAQASPEPCTSSDLKVHSTSVSLRLHWLANMPVTTAEPGGPYNSHAHRPASHGHDCNQAHDPTIFPLWLGTRHKVCLYPTNSVLSLCSRHGLITHCNLR
ncbi:hypothetical protein QJQ45_019538, partial [Haematococcus lacustris]